jgi:alkylated DNA repair dioxygenase AlkB
MQLDLLARGDQGSGEVVHFTLPDAEVSLWPGFLARSEADRGLVTLQRELVWRQDTIQMWGRTYDVPRLQQWCADPGLCYTWSGIRMEPAPWHPLLLALRGRLRALLGIDFNSALANLYRDGRDTVGWHADDEPELGEAPIIASVSLGATRDFVLRHRRRRELPVTTIPLAHGSLLVMRGATQACWEHALPRRLRVAAPRVNLTFRVARAEGSI